MAIEAIDHVRESVRKLLFQFQDKPNFKALVQAFAKELNELETAIAEVRAITIANAFGQTLDNEGSLLGVYRLGRADDDYRAAIQAQVQINAGASTIEDVLFALTAALPGGVFFLSEPEPAVVYVIAATELDGVTNPSAETMAAVLDAAVGAGIRHILFYNTVADAPANTLTFAAGNTPTASTAQGWANDGQTQGGYWSDAIA